MRTFIAIELPQEIKDSLERLQAGLKQTGADVKWVNPENIHLTLKFLGEVDEGKIKDIEQTLEGVALNYKQFSIRPFSIGVFPKMEFPKVIWIGIDKGDNETKLIAGELEQNLAQIGMPKEDRPFSSHITIGRTKSFLNRNNLIRELKNLEGKIEGKFREFPVTRLTLLKSTLTPKGPTYEILKEVSLTTT
ncbi:MAG: RNA 2',3'-cyclic phosphodiesterase [Candidatus Omnitrophica bacterium]|nr:RNA 2',3'-cyclic phosphodiesterase [Candidatus Omnitrophota bacterium]